MAAPRRNIAAVVTLLFVSPLVAEYLLGDLPLTLLPALIVLAPAYGGGALLIREAARRTGRGWPTMLLLGAAYSLIAEGLVTQSLFNHDYMKLHMHLLDHAYIPSLGIGAWWTLFMLNLHTFWSMGVSIGLVEALFPLDAEEPWLGQFGDWIVAVVFVAGSAENFEMNLKRNNFLASKAQLIGVLVISALLIVSAFLIPVRRSRKGGIRATTGSSIKGAIAFALGFGVLITPPSWGWIAVGTLAALDALFVVLLVAFSQRGGCSGLHKLSLAAGGALAYGIHAFTQKPIVGGTAWMRVSNTLLLAAAVLLVWIDAKRVRRQQNLTTPSPMT